MNKYVTGDTHFGHQKMVDTRGFSSKEEMDEEMIRRWNEVVKPEDMVYHLGDFAFNKKHQYYLDKLNGHIHLIMGNHDEDFSNSYMNKLSFVSVSSMKYIRHGDHKIHLLHYPMESWRKSHHGSFHFHGHTHGSTKPRGRRIDAGVDCWDLRPVSFDMLIDKLKDEDITNHH
jgi:calcineurin-like phosphoesterase family protein